ncbi:hypothetical protein NL676_016269 [Syzygium grande]|nr:hypothetical protein NL676_016269 [Syzygium grande]
MGHRDTAAVRPTRHPPRRPFLPRSESQIPAETEAQRLLLFSCFLFLIILPHGVAALRHFAELFTLRPIQLDFLHWKPTPELNFVRRKPRAASHTGCKDRPLASSGLRAASARATARLMD